MAKSESFPIFIRLSFTEFTYYSETVFSIDYLYFPYELRYIIIQE